MNLFAPQLAARAVVEFRRSGNPGALSLMEADGAVLAMLSIEYAALGAVHGMSDLLGRIGRSFSVGQARTENEWDQAPLQTLPLSLDALCWQLGKAPAPIRSPLMSRLRSKTQSDA